MQKESTIQQFGLKAVGLILALLILIAGTAGINICLNGRIFRPIFRCNTHLSWE